MTTYDREPERRRILTGADEISAYVHPIRMKILSLLSESPATMTMIAKSLDTRPANLSHHFRRLEKTGLISLVEIRTTSKNIEKFYRAKARSFIVASGQVPSADQASLALSILRDELGIAADRAREGSRGEHFALLASARIPPSRRAAFRESLQELVRSFESGGDSSAEPYTLALALFPAALADLGAPRIMLEEDGGTDGGTVTRGDLP